MLEDELLANEVKVILIRSHLEGIYEMFSRAPGEIPMSYLSWILQMGMGEPVDADLTEAQVSAGIAYLTEQVTEINTWLRPVAIALLISHVCQVRAHPVTKLICGAW